MKKKVCIKCGKTYVHKIHSRRRICGKCRYSGYQKEKHKEYRSDPEVRKKIQETAKKKRATKYELVRKIKSDSGCIDCGITDWRVLEFDHIGDKTIGVSYLVSRNYCVETIMEEIKKCVVRCANCHRIKTFERREQK